jgi:hypothetical protein
MSEQRERFEAWAAGRFELHWHVDAERYASAITQAAWESWQAACPEGWQAVPDTADEKMLSEGVESLTRGQKLFGNNLAQIVSNIHEDMLSAAPEPGEGQ